eukprot:scaffold167799_cov55-Attheya_sp.AAC.2
MSNLLSPYILQRFQDCSVWNILMVDGVSRRKGTIQQPLGYLNLSLDSVRFKYEFGRRREHLCRLGVSIYCTLRVSVACSKSSEREEGAAFLKGEASHVIPLSQRLSKHIPDIFASQSVFRSFGRHSLPVGTALKDEQSEFMSDFCCRKDSLHHPLKLAVGFITRQNVDYAIH